MQLIRLILKKASRSGSGPTGSSAVAEYTFDGSLFTIGSDAANTIVLSESAPEQAVLIQEGEILTLINSAEGTSVNGRALRREAIEPLTSGDEIQIGDHVIAVQPSSSAGEVGRNGSAARIEMPSNPQVLTGYMRERPEPEPSEKKPGRNFADVLNTLRTDEDSFYFIIDDGEREEGRILIEQSEISLGVGADGEISSDADRIVALHAIVRKEWGEIVVEPQTAPLFVNGEKTTAPRHLRNGDRLSFLPPRKNKEPLSLELHEPSSLVALESILETRPRNRNLHGTQDPSAGTNDLQKAVPISDRRFFGHFSFLEVVTMSVGTLIAAVVIFLLLELTAR